MNSEKYWREREEAWLKKNQKNEKEYEEEIERIYTHMMDAIDREISAFYGRYADKEQITLAEAKKRVSEMDIKAYERKAKEYVKNRTFSKEVNQELRLYNLTMKVNRLEMLKANIGLELITGYDDLEKLMEEVLQGRTTEELERQAGILGKTIKNNSKLAEAIAGSSFHNATFYDRVHMYHGLTKADMSALLERGLIQGQSARWLAKEMKYRLDIREKDALRLMRTELARVQTEAQKQSFERNGFKLYRFICNVNPTHGNHTCPDCERVASTQTKYGKGVYLVEKMMPGTNAPPMHPHCRCSTAAYEDSKDYEEWLEFLANGGTTEEYNEKKKTKYKGIPKDWKSLAKGEQVMDVNPEERMDNCVNCSIAYEMRKRDLSVIAGEGVEELWHNPFAGWEDPDVVDVEPGKGAADYVRSAMAIWGKGARAQVAVKWNEEYGHSFVAEQGEIATMFIDIQNGRAYTVDEINSIFGEVVEIQFCRIDELELSDLGATACKAR